MENFGAADVVVGLEKEFDVECGVVLARDRCLRWPCQFAPLARYAFGGYPRHGCEDRGDLLRSAPRQVSIRENPRVPEAPFEFRPDAVDLPLVIARPSCAAGLRVTTSRHLVLLLWQYARQPAVTVSASL